MNGQAIDRHFVGLQMVAKEAGPGIGIHDFFKDEGFLKSVHYNLNTANQVRVSQLATLYSLRETTVNLSLKLGERIKRLTRRDRGIALGRCRGRQGEREDNL